MDQDIEYWLQLARLDLENARRSLRGESYLHCIFGCQQSLEKLLKALVVKSTATAPPRTHNLIRLADLTGVSLSMIQQQFLSKLSVEYIETRYPGEFHALDEFNTRPAAEEHLRETETLFQWLETQTK